jgi:hypothetical protein
MNCTQQPETSRHLVTGQTLQEALDNVRQQFGERACIVETRTASRRDDDGLGHTRLIEVSVVLPAVKTPAEPIAPERDRAEISDAIIAEIERIEHLVENLKPTDDDIPATDGVGFADYALGKALLTAGTSLPAVRHLRRLNVAESGRTDMASARDHLMGLMRTSGGQWETLAGCHLFLGRPGAGKTDLILATAARLKTLDKRVLVLAYAPRHHGEVIRLQEEASARGYDAAILRDAAQLAGGLEYFAQYDAVLIDTPSLGSPALADEELHDLLAGQENIHRHMLMPMDAGLTERELIWGAARDWNCDWFAVTRLDLTKQSGKLVDVLLAAPQPVSLVGGGAWPGTYPDIATPELLISRILTNRTDNQVETHTGQASA